MSMFATTVASVFMKSPSILMTLTYMKYLESLNVGKFEYPNPVSS